MPHAAECVKPLLVSNLSVFLSKTTTSFPGPTNHSNPSQDGPFDWDREQQGTILGAFFWGYVCTQIPGGMLAERYGGKLIFGLGILVTSVFTILTPLAARGGFVLLIICR